MKKILAFVVCLTVVTGYSPVNRLPLQPSATSVNIVPLPASITTKGEFIPLANELTIVASSTDEKNVASFLDEFFTTKNCKVSIRPTADKHQVIVLKTINDPSLGREGYTIAMQQHNITITANTGAGLFYGVQSLIQLIGTGKRIPVGNITDHPRFAYRGLHLDVGRHIFPVAFIKKYIDMMAHFKYNTFHWHLTEDQGWRIEIKKYPKLQEVASHRTETVVGHASTRTRDQAQYDGKPYGGFYTQEEIKDVVAYAAKRYITIIPEIEMPGHSQAALTAYPYLGCTGGPYQVATTWGVFDDVFCAGKETTFEFLEDVIDEVVTLFPGKYIHVGGDECPKTNWEKCPYCQKRIKDENLTNTHELQSYFIQRMEKYINAKGKSIIGWDEILEGGLAPNATVMSWRGEEGGIAAAKQKHHVIMTPGNWCYLDHYQADPKTEPLAIGGLTPVSEVYSYEPISSQLSPEEATYVLGAQCNLWTEYIPTSDYAEYMVYPRAIAMAEVLWSPKETRNYDSFVNRIRAQQTLLDQWHINYAKHIFSEEKKESTKQITK